MAQGGTVYLIHFARPYRHAQHYLGWTQDLERRIAEHRAGRGSPPLVAAAVGAGIEIQLAEPWPGNRNLERRLHRYNNSPRRLCPICRGEPIAAAAIARPQLDSIDELAIAALSDLGRAVTLPVLTAALVRRRGGRPVGSLHGRLELLALRGRVAKTWLGGEIAWSAAPGHG